MKILKTAVLFGACTLFALSSITSPAGQLTGAFSRIPQGSVVNLTAEGALDWVHWGLHTETSLTRKSGVTPRIGNFTPIGWNGPWRFDDNFNGYSWMDGTPTVSQANTPVGVWMMGVTNGFEVRVPADTTPRTFKIYVGAYGARGRLTARLSDDSAEEYVNTSLANMGNGESAVYQIDYAANSISQELIVRWTVSQILNPVGNVTLQAAALTSSDANNPPYVTITSPQAGTNIPTPADVTIEVEAGDADGTVQTVEFFSGETKIGETADAPYTFLWSNAPPGAHRLTAVATDDQGASSISTPAYVFVHTGEGTLGGETAFPPGAVDLTDEGTADWAHWGLASAESVNRKAGVPPQIGDLTIIGAAPAEQYSDNFTAYSWSDGTPVEEEWGTQNGIYVTGYGNGFELSLPAGTTPRTAKVYVGLYGSHGHFQAFLNDGSAPAYTDTSLDSVWGHDYAVHTIQYAAASEGQTLTVRYRISQMYDSLYGNLTLQAVTLAGEATVILAPVASFTANPNPAVPGETVTFDAGGSTHQDPERSIVQYDWDFVDESDGTLVASASGEVVAQTFTNPGLYRAQLTVTDDNVPARTATESILITVEDLPVVQLAGWFEEGAFHLRVQGPDGLRGSIEASRTFAEWAPIGLFLIESGGIVDFVDAEAGQYDWRFYRAVVEEEQE